MSGNRLLFFVLALAFPFCGFSQTEVDKKEMKGLIERLEKAEANKQVQIVKLENLQTDKAAVQQKYYDNTQKLNALDAIQPKWDSVTLIEDDKGNVVDKKFHQKPQSVVQWETDIRTAITEHYSLLKNMQTVDKDIAAGELDRKAAEEEIKQAKKLIKLKENYFKILKMVYPDRCGTPPGPEAPVLVLKAYWDCVFDGTPINQGQLDENNIQRGTNAFSTDAVVVPEYNKKEREAKEKKIEEMIRNSTAPVKTPIIVPPPSPDPPKTEPTATDRLKEALKNFLPKPARRATGISAVRG